MVRNYIAKLQLIKFMTILWEGGGGARNGGIRDFAILNGGIRDLAKIWGGNRDLRHLAGVGLSRFSWRETGFLATGGIGI